MRNLSDWDQGKIDYFQGVFSICCLQGFLAIFSILRAEMRSGFCSGLSPGHFFPILLVSYYSISAVEIEVRKWENPTSQREWAMQEPEDAHRCSCCRAQEGKAMGAELRWFLTRLAFWYVMFQLFSEKWGTCVGKTIKSARIIYLGFETENLAELFYRKNKC